MTYVPTFERAARQEGIEQGVEQGIEQGRLEQARVSVIDNLTARFESVTPETQDLLQQMDDLDQLRGLARRAVLAESLEAFLEALPGA